ncbi:Sm-like ribonucleoprotein [Saccharata proteae CBS 121410]|uniref:LSM2-LSM8 complex subunit LSM8 n=1 Tax=Saccharata proteae CBS 121410 TaxID=1314787 RepID=A0A9P4HKY2_9PEZI|nr:Sm-like ribonucleoprotein [Saccharata proteae CBS 121410]
MSQVLHDFINNKVAIITIDGQYYVGTLLGGDYNTNLILHETVERIIYPADDQDGENRELRDNGVRVLRGDNVVIIGLVDEALDDSIDWTKVKGEPIRSTRH